MGKPRHLIASVTAVALAVMAGCSNAASGGTSDALVSGGRSSSPSSSPPASTPYVPAAGTDTTGAIFDTFTDSKHRFHMMYPGGWRVSTAKGVVRIAKLQNAILIATRDAKNAPKVKGVKAALAMQLKNKTILDIEVQPRAAKLDGGKALRMQFTKARPATDTTPAGELRVVRYLLFHKGLITILSLQSPTDRDNSAAYRFLANSFRWG
jgi:hypothetical protein